MARRPRRPVRDKSGRELTEEEIREREIKRIRLPKGKETLGIVDQRLGAGRLRVRCLDGNVRVCRIPGRMKRYLWVRENDIVLVEPWEYSHEEKGDVIYKYRHSQVDWLRRKGHLDDLTESEEF